MNIEHSFIADLPELGQVEKDIAETEDHLQVGALMSSTDMDVNSLLRDYRNRELLVCAFTTLTHSLTVANSCCPGRAG